MPRTLGLLTGCALALVFCLPGRAQDSPSLGDLARQAQKNKANATTPAKKVLTNDDLPSDSATNSAGGFGAGLGRVGQQSSGSSGTAQSSSDEIAHLELLLNQLDTMDGKTLAKNVLQGSAADFPGRSQWEEKLFAAKQVFVAQGRDLIKRALEINASAKNVQDIKDPNDPRVKDLSNRLKQLVQDGVRIGGTFQGVIEEGKDLASQSSSH